MKSDPATIRSLALFCKVVDNFGDIGICYRLASQLVAEYGIQVSLWVDDLVSFARICPAVDPQLSEQQADGIHVVHWCEPCGDYRAEQVADLVIEFFGCDLPPSYIAAMKLTSPVWINLEGLTAEDWVESCHTLPSPQFGLTKYFYYPGFAAKTGGLLRESGLAAQRDRFLAAPGHADQFLRRFGVTDDELAGLRVSLFCYAHAPVKAMLDAWTCSASPVTCLVPQGVAVQQIDDWLSGADSATHGALTLRRIPFLPQQDYDQLLWSCDVNFVRGEDSFVRAQWAGRPFIWHIYPQDKNLHHQKLNAFLKRYQDQHDTPIPSIDKLWRAWNEVDQCLSEFPSIWEQFIRDRSEIANLTRQWQTKLLTNGDLARNLMQFAGSIRLKNQQNKL